MDAKSKLTTEEIRKKFKNQFDLVNYAIRLAENMIVSGRDPQITIDSQNRAILILGEIAAGKDHFVELLPAASVEIDHEERKTANDLMVKSSKKGRKALVE